MKIIFLVLFVAIIVMLWVITKQEQKIIELNHEINMRKLGMKGDEVIHVVIFSRKDYKLLLELKQEVKRCQELLRSLCAGSYGCVSGITDGQTNLEQK